MVSPYFQNIFKHNILKDRDKDREIEIKDYRRNMDSNYLPNFIITEWLSESEVLLISPLLSDKLKWSQIFIYLHYQPRLHETLLYTGPCEESI